MVKKTICSIGNSYGITIDKKILESEGLGKGSELNVDYEPSTGKYIVYLRGYPEERKGYTIPLYLNVPLAKKIIAYIKENPSRICDMKFLYSTPRTKVDFEAIKDHFLRTGNMVLIDYRLHWFDNSNDAPKVKYKTLTEQQKAEIAANNECAIKELENQGALDPQEEEILDLATENNESS